MEHGLGPEIETPGEPHLNGKVTLYHGDSREVLKQLPDNSIDSVVTDPPYALVSIVKRFGGANAAPAKGNDAYQRASAGFMGQQWDTGETAFAVEFWAEVMRVLKPGGHVIAASGTRTYHRLAVAIEDAGFEIRDQILWIFGSGFPKSHSVFKGLWKGVLNCQLSESAPLAVQISESIHLKSSEAREPIAVAPALILPVGAPALIMQIGRAEDSHAPMVMLLSESEADSISLSTGWSWNRQSAENWKPANTSTTETKFETTTILEILRSWMSLTTEDTTHPNVTLANGWKWPVATVANPSCAVLANIDAIPTLTVLGDATWNPVVMAEGLGSALKPATEPWVLARKPLGEKTVAANVLAHGCGALNIDGCRVEGESTERHTFKKLTSKGAKGGAYGNQGHKYPVLDEKFGTGSPLGRFPANVIHDGSDEVLAGFPDVGKSPGTYTRSARAKGEWLHAKEAGTTQLGFGDSGSAARFFYSAKADSMDRVGSKHPTVKPVDLMQYLCRLITPPGGVVLDPFAGSGSTGEAAWREGFRCVLIEREEEYAADIRRRLELADLSPETRAAILATRKADEPLGGLFAAMGDE